MACHSFTRSRDILRGGKHAQTLQGVDDAGRIRSDRRSNRRYRWRQCTTRHRRRRRRSSRRRRRRPGQRQRHRGCRLLRHHRHRVRPGERGDRRRRHAPPPSTSSPRRTASTSTTPAPATSRSRSTPRSRAATRPTSPSSRSRASSPASPAAATCSPCPTTCSPTSAPTGRPTWMSFGERRRHPVRRPDQDRPQVARVVHPVDVRRVRLHGADHARRVLRPHRPDDRRRPHPAVRRHRVRAGHRLAVHRLGRGAGAAQPGHRLLQPVGDPRDPVQRPADRRGDADRRRPVGQARRGVRRRRHDRGDAVPDPTPSRCSTATA